MPTPTPTTRSQLKHQTYLAIAQQLSRLSTCLRLQVGCVLLRGDGSVAGVGYNGALPGFAHCVAETCNPDVRCYRTRHAERSALDYSSGDIAVAYTTHEPCLRCAQDLIARGCASVYYLTPYLAKDSAETLVRKVLVRDSGIRWSWANPDGSDRAYVSVGCSSHNIADKDQFPYV